MELVYEVTVNGNNVLYGMDTCDNNDGFSCGYSCSGNDQ